jgi:hypothetical protein
MKKFCLGLLLLITSASGFAQVMTCLEKLVPYSRFAGHHTVAKEEWYDGKEFLDADGAKAAITFLLHSKLLCKTNEVVIKIEPACSHQIEDIQQSLSCFVYTNLGHFVLNRDNGRNINLIFTRDKRFSGSLEE